MGLLFHLGRNLGEARVLLVGTYRPAEVALGRNGERHPLEKVLAEFKRYFGDLTVDLGAATDDERRLLVDEILDSEPHRLSNAFREAIYRHTYGHPLFTVELLRALRERGDLVADRDGMWVEAPSLSWGELPARVEGVIEERIGRLDGELHDTLAVASVEGEEFTAEVVAAVDGAEARHVVRRLGRELENRHRLVRSGGLRRLGNGVRLSLFSFQHNLFQRYLYDELNESERAYLHEDVGTALEQLCGADTDVYAVQLARHFVVAGDSARASIYLRRAGQLALARYAYEEAVIHLTTALELTASSDFEARWDLVAAREEAFGSLGRRDPQWADLELLRQLARESQGRWRLVDAELRVAHFCRSTGDFSAAIAAAERALEVLGNKRDVAREATAYIEWGAALVDLARNEEARQKLERALGLADSAGLHGARGAESQSARDDPSRAWRSGCGEAPLPRGPPDQPAYPEPSPGGDCDQWARRRGGAQGQTRGGAAPLRRGRGASPPDRRPTAGRHCAAQHR